MIEEPLSQRARALLDQALAEENALSPDPSRRRRLKRALLQSVALAGAGGAATAKVASAMPLLTLGKSIGVGLLVSGSVLGGAQLIAVPSAPSAAQGAPGPGKVMRVAPPVVPVAASEVAVEQVESPSPAADVAAPAASASAPSPSPSAAPALRAELELLNAAQAAQRDGNAAHALALLERYDVRFPAGQMTNERLAVEVFAACGLGNRPRAMRAASRFLQRDSSSALAERVKRACPVGQEGDAP
jgi:hypothetical protein